jgi:uncharacterized protein YebE (UPF0316 family)
MDIDIYAFIILPLMIFTARIFDVTIGTVRIILVAKGQKRIAPLLGFLEVLIWIIVIGQIMNNLDNWICYLAYAAGFATGNYVGMIIEERLALGMVGLRLITAKPASELIEVLKENGFGLTYMHAQGAKGPVNILYITVPRKRLTHLVNFINDYNPAAFYTIEDIRFVNKGVFADIIKKARYSFLRKGK